MSVIAPRKRPVFHGVRPHCVAERCFARLLVPSQIWLCEALYHDSRAAREQFLELPNTALIADPAYPESEFEESLKRQNTRLLTICKKPKGKELTKFEKYHNRLISKFCRAD
ncbi:MAG: hypothetical protein ACR2N3_09730 [Pyrinomonadaceae bacterium]